MGSLEEWLRETVNQPGQSEEEEPFVQQVGNWIEIRLFIFAGQPAPPPHRLPWQHLGLDGTHPQLHGDYLLHHLHHHHQHHHHHHQQHNVMLTGSIVLTEPILNFIMTNITIITNNANVTRNIIITKNYTADTATITTTWPLTSHCGDRHHRQHQAS